MAGRDTVGMARRVLDHHGLNYEVKRGKHVKIVVDYEGRKQTFVTGGTISDGRAIMNFYHTIKKLLTGLGVPFEECKGLCYN
jgi:hypothetical protein